MGKPGKPNGGQGGCAPLGIPRSVRVGAIDYRVMLVNRSAIRADGLCEYGASRIKIDRGLSVQEKLLTLWHEILHAVTYEASVKMSEEDNDRIARLIFSVVRDNPGLVGRYRP